MRISFILIILGLFVFEHSAFSHDGRRFEIEIIDNQLWAQGLIVGGSDDGGGIVRPYYNSIHDHWSNAPGIKDEARALNPAWDLLETDDLLGESVVLELVSAFKWVDPPLMPPPGTTPDFESLSSIDDLVSISYFGQEIDTNTLGQIELIQNVDIHGHVDMELEYFIERKPSEEIFVFEWQLSTTAVGIGNSESIFAVLSPDGSTPEERLHHASLFTEQYFGVVPEPGTSALLLAGSFLLMSRRRRTKLH